MPPTPADLSGISRGSEIQHVPRPSSRLLTRALVPAVIVVAVLALLAYAARDALSTAIPVSVAPVVLRAGGAAGAGADPLGETVQAPGWIEADPSARGVPALSSGVLKELLVLDGERVEQGQVVALLIDEDAKLALHHAQAQVARAAAMTTEAREAVAVEEARAEEARELVGRVESLTGTGAVAEGEVVNRRLKLASQLALVASARAAVTRAEADEQSARVGVEQAELELSRMSVRAPVGGVVLQRLAEPGQRLMPDANNPFAGVVLRLYDPAHLQLRVDVPLADAAKVRIGDGAEITTEALPGRTFKGTLTRFVHEANLQKNTVQVKVSIADPAPELKPDMLAKARIATRSSRGGRGSSPEAGKGTESAMIMPRGALLDASDGQGAAWVLDVQTSTAVKRTLRIGHVSDQSADVLEGLRPGDMVILNPPAGLKPGTKVRPLDEKGGS